MIKIGGVRRQGDTSKVLLNSHIFRVNDVVDRSLALRLVEIRSDQLVFEDEHGQRYFRNY